VLEASLSNGGLPITPTVEVRLTRLAEGLDWSGNEEAEQVHPNRKSEDVNIAESLKVSTVSAGSSLCRESGSPDPHTEQQEKEELSASVSYPPADRMTGSTQHGKRQEFQKGSDRLGINVRESVIAASRGRTPLGG